MAVFLEESDNGAFDLVRRLEHDRQADDHGRQTQRNRQRKKDESGDKDSAADRHENGFFEHRLCRLRKSGVFADGIIEQYMAIFEPAYDTECSALILG